jgi:hypothetical protein
VFNACPGVLRSALVGARLRGEVVPVICVELDRGQPVSLLRDLARLAEGHEHTRAIRHFLVHPSFPVDIRHNAKIFREKLADWASRQMEKKSRG